MAYLVENGQNEIVERGQVLAVAEAGLVQRNVNVVAFACLLANVVKIWLAKIRPEASVVISVPRDIQNSVIKQVTCFYF